MCNSIKTSHQEKRDKDVFDETGCSERLVEFTKLGGHKQELRDHIEIGNRLEPIFELLEKKEMLGDTASRSSFKTKHKRAKLLITIRTGIRSPVRLEVSDSLPKTVWSM